MSWAERFRCGVGRRAFSPLSEGGSLEKLTSSSGSAASERTATVTARLKGSEGLSGLAIMTLFELDPRLRGDAGSSRDQHLSCAFRQFLAEAPLIEFRHAGAF